MQLSDREKQQRILVVDDAPDTLEVLQRNLSGQGYRVFTAKDANEAIRILEAEPIDLVITDLKMPKVSGLELIRHIRDNVPDSEVMMITGYASIEGAVEAVKTGADEYLAKPFTDEELFSAVQRSLDKLNVRRAGHRKSLRTEASSYGLIGESDQMQKVYVAIEKASAISATVLISGESGTGKELVARTTPAIGHPHPSSR
jgi:DNA-binding NtrC family response regulator